MKLKRKTSGSSKHGKVRIPVDARQAERSRAIGLALALAAFALLIYAATYVKLTMFSGHG